MKQKRINNMSDLLAQSLKAIGGAGEVGAGLLVINTEALISAERAAFITARDNYQTGKTLLKTKQAVVRSVTLTTRAFVKLTRNVLEKDLGSKYSAAWNALGFNGSLTIPYSPDRVLVLAEALKAYLTAQPTAQVDDLDITAARAESLVNSLQEAITAANSQRTTVKQLLQTRNTAEATLRKRLRDLILELQQKLGSMDPRWLAFGLNLPGAKHIPSVPANLSAVLIGETAAAIKWEASARAEHYRVWKKVTGVDEEFVAVGSPADLDFTMEELPRNSTIEVAVSAVNNGGESGLSHAVSVVTH
jgi:hypothetical protein